VSQKQVVEVVDSNPGNSVPFLLSPWVSDDIKKVLGLKLRLCFGKVPRH